MLVCYRYVSLVKRNRIRGGSVRGVLRLVREAAAGQEDAQLPRHCDHASRHDQPTLVQHDIVNIIAAGTAGVTYVAPPDLDSANAAAGVKGA